MVADTKKVQTMINICANQAQIARTAASRMLAVRTAFTTHNPDVTGTPLEGNVAIVSQAITDLSAEANKGIWDAMIAARVPSHRGEAMEV